MAQPSKVRSHHNRLQPGADSGDFSDTSHGAVRVALLLFLLYSTVVSCEATVNLSTLKCTPSLLYSFTPF